MKNLYIQFIIFFCIGTMALFYYYATYNKWAYNYLYYLWDKSSYFFLASGYLFFLKGKLKRIMYLFSGFLLIRLFWQILELENVRYANRPHIIDIIFFINVAAIICIVFISRKKPLKPPK